MIPRNLFDGHGRVVERAQPQVSAWLLRRLGLESEMDWELGDPFAMIADIPAALRRRVLVENALAVYGERLLRPHAC